MYLKIILFALSILIVSGQINWQSGQPTGTNWALACDFKNNDLSNKQVAGPDCAQTCASTSGCTHFTWTSYNGGTCWMKSGSISKSNALSTGDQSMVCGIYSGFPNPNPPSNGVSFTTVNKCSYTVWVGTLGQSKKQPTFNFNGLGYNSPFGGGYQLNSGQSKSFTVPSDWFGARIWPRTNCKTVNGQFVCETGDCGPYVQCSSGNIPRGGAPPATLAEFTLNGAGNQDFLDLSLVDGFNVPMQIQFTNPSNPPAGANPKYWCTTINCQANVNANCPQELKKYNSAGQVVGCQSACLKFNTDQYCCRGSYGPTNCQSANWPVNYPAFFKQQCPDAYSYAYDDHKSTWTCRNTNYVVQFC